MSSAPGAPELHFILFGLSGSGVSSTGNTITGQNEFKVGLSFDSITKNCQRVTCFRFGRKIEVIDTPGFPNDLDENQTNEILAGLKQGLGMMSTGFKVFLLVSSIDRFTEDSKEMVRRLTKLPEIQKHTIVIFTGYEKFVGSERETRERISSSESLKELMKLSSNRFILFNNKTNDEKQVKELFKVAEELIANQSAVLDTSIFSATVEAHVTATVFKRKNYWIFDVLRNILEEWVFIRPRRVYRNNCTIL